MSDASSAVTGENQRNRHTDWRRLSRGQAESQVASTRPVSDTIVPSSDQSAAISDTLAPLLHPMPPPALD